MFLLNIQIQFSYPKNKKNLVYRNLKTIFSTKVLQIVTYRKFNNKCILQPNDTIKIIYIFLLDIATWRTYK